MILSDQKPPPVSLTTAFWYWLKLGFVSFGGPAGQIALMHADLVERRRWISDRRFLHALNYCMLLPGPEATQLAVYIGWLMHKTRGGIMAGVLFVLPSVLILITLSWAYITFGRLPVVLGILYGVKPAVVAIILAAAWRIGRRTINNAALGAVALAAFVAITVFRLPFPLIVLCAAVIGMFGARLRPDLFQIGGHVSAQARSYGPALIDDDTPTPSHARLSWPRMTVVVLGGVLLGALVAALIVATTHPINPLSAMAWFFTKAALLSFGGAYAVLPYVYQGAVESFRWVSADQMMDGLALGETTPGPLIMVVAFVAYIGSWTQALWGDGNPVWAGIGGACVATFFTFLPSFILILAGGPLVESTRDNLRMTAPLTAISAAVVGVIVSLGVFFGEHVFYVITPEVHAGASSYHIGIPMPHWDVGAITISAAACVALMHFKISTIRLLFACAATGVVLSYLNQ